MKRGAAAFLLLAAMTAWPLTAQSQSRQPTVAELEDEIATYVRRLADWGGLIHYGSENAELRPTPGRVIFIGDEIIEDWGEGAAPFFPGKPYLNRGIAGQTTPQMLVRFRQDVIDLKPAVVVIQGGSNDLAGNTGPATTGTIADNVMDMAELAKLHGIAVVLVSTTPVCDCIPASPRRHLTLVRTHGKLLAVNEWMKDYAAKAGAVFLDLYSVLAQGRAIKKEFTVDGLQLTDAGYAAILPHFEKAISQAMEKKK